jgi:hypothetical protein
MSARGTNGSVLPGCGLPAHVVVALDGMISAGIIEARTLDRLNADQMVELARAAIRQSLRGFSADDEIARILRNEPIAA